MQTWRESVAALQQRSVGIADQELAAYITARDRLDEAEFVEECIERAALGELDPTGWLVHGASGEADSK